MKYSVVIPAYRSSSTLPSLCQGIIEVLEPIAKGEFEILIVDDRSPDAETWPCVMRLAAQHAPVRGIRLSRNFGQQAATICGLFHTTGNHAITLDDDMQHDPEHIPVLLEKANHHDVVIAQLTDRQHSLSTRLTSRIKAYFDYLVLGKPRSLQLSSFRVISRAAIDRMRKIRSSNPFIPALIFRSTQDVVGVSLPHRERGTGRSNYTFLRRARLFSNLIINNSTLMLKVGLPSPRGLVGTPPLCLMILNRVSCRPCQVNLPR